MNIEDLTLYVGTSSQEIKEVRPGAVIDLKGNLIFKTEYHEGDNYEPICYNEAGERWHGNLSTRVYPVEIGR